MVGDFGWCGLPFLCLGKIQEMGKDFVKAAGPSGDSDSWLEKFMGLIFRSGRACCR